VEPVAVAVMAGYAGFGMGRRSDTGERQRRPNEAFHLVSLRDAGGSGIWPANAPAGRVKCYGAEGRNSRVAHGANSIGRVGGPAFRGGISDGLWCQGCDFARPETKSPGPVGVRGRLYRLIYLTAIAFAMFGWVWFLSRLVKWIFDI
jgi:hypothetical protein